MLVTAKSGRFIELPNDTEDELINAGIALDSDTYELSEMEFSQLKPLDFLMNIKIHKDYYRSNNIVKGRVISKFFEQLAKEVFEHSYQHWKSYNEINPNKNQLPLIYNERNLYSTFAAAIEKITSIHISEWSFNQSEHENLDRNRRVDIWCLKQDSNYNISYFIEIKKSNYRQEKIQLFKPKPDFSKNINKNITKNIKKLTEQIDDIRKLSPDWGHNNVFLGICVIDGFCSPNKIPSHLKKIRENIFKLIENHNCQLIMSTWILEDNMNIIFEDGKKCEFISIVGIVMTEIETNVSE